MNVILDSSSLLCLIKKEPGHEKIKAVLDRAIMSSVNVAEVVAVLTRYNVSKDDITLTISQLIKEVIAFDEEQAYLTGSLEKMNKEQKLGLSLGDRACIILGKTLGLAVYTTDKAWLKLKDTKIHVIR